MGYVQNPALRYIKVGTACFDNTTGKGVHEGYCAMTKDRPLYAWSSQGGCWNQATGNKAADSNCPPITASVSTSGKVTGTVKDVGAALWGVFSAQNQQKGASSVYGAQGGGGGGMPGWVMPVAIGVAGIGVVLLLTGKKRPAAAASPAANPARRRRARRRR